MRARLRRHWHVLVVVISATVTTVGALNSDGPFWWRTWLGITALAITFATGLLAGYREAIAYLRAETASYPKAVHVSENEDGDTVALVETWGGELISLDVPDEIAEQGPEAVAHWVAESMMS